MELDKVGPVGTKINPNDCKHLFQSWKNACKLDAQLKIEVNELLWQAEKADLAELSPG